MKHRTPKVLVAPLEWGLGHATRCIPIIRELLNQNADVTICATGACKILLENEFPDIPLIEIPGIIVHYPKNGKMFLAIATQIPSILKAIRNEHTELEKIIAAHKFTHVISDNRFGFYASTVKSAFVTHQIKIKGGKGFKFIENFLFQMNKKYLDKFNEIWIPDVNTPGNLSGELSNTAGVNNNISYVGMLSRFTDKINNQIKQYEMVALLSGPEPQRTLLETKVRAYFLASGKKCLIIQGLPAKTESYTEGKVEIIPSISNSGLMNVLHAETLLISRSGYSTLMDLAILDHRKVLFIPTPGQTEQEYLADHLFHTFGYRYIAQHEKIPVDLNFEGKKLPSNNPDNLISTIKKFLTT
ncbi:MAG TPA: glycosyltransferase [Bacteroidia bacterium]|nr:glycosyltransferase [Bacteroidia bacterium]